MYDARATYNLQLTNFLSLKNSREEVKESIGKKVVTRLPVVELKYTRWLDVVSFLIE